MEGGGDGVNGLCKTKEGREEGGGWGVIEGVGG